MQNDFLGENDGMSAANILDLMKDLTKKAPKQRVRSSLVKKK